MCAVVQSSNHHLQNMLQRAVQGVQWTYSLFWQLCPQQGILVWGDGYYNGAIKTRKTIQPMEVSAEEASLQRSQQLRELYDSLSAGETNQPTRRPSAALSPEDLTESEWFYLMCVSFSFAPGIGLPGRAYAKRQYVWLTGANEVDSKVFTRAILAKSARVQTVVCIPLLDGVVELGTTERVEEEVGFIQHVKNYFLEHEKPAYNHPKPALSEHSTSNPAAAHTCNFQYSSSHGGGAPTYQIEEEGEEDEEEYEDDDEEDEDEEEEEEEGDSESEVNEKNIRSRLGQNPNSQQCQTEPSELMQLDMSEDIRIGSPDENDGSNNLDSNDYHHRLIHQTRTHHDLFRSETVNRWPAAAMGDPPHINTTTTTLQPPPPTSSEVPAMEELIEEDTHYSQTVSTILQNQSSRSSDTSSSIPYFSCSSYSSFSNWSSDHHHLGTTSSSQWLLKYVLFTVPFLHSKYRSDHENSSPKSRDTASADVGSRIFRRGTAASQEDLSANHVLAERRRREKLNERFVILRSLVPFVTKMDKASILGDTIEYVKQLRKRIQDLESRQSDADRRSRSSSGEGRNNAMSTATNNYNQIRKMRIIEENIVGGSQGKAVAVGADGEVEVEDVEVEVEVSIIESDALIEVQCRNREGLLLDIMQMLRELRVEITAVQSSVNNGVFAAELRAKVKDNVNGKRATITEVKRALHHIIRHYSGLL